MNNEKISGIYEIRNNVNGKVYIGQSIDIHLRNNQEINKLNKGKFHNEHLQSAWNKYGKDNFIFNTIIYELNEDQLDEYEIAIIKFTKSYIKEYGYNKTFGGEGGSPTEETRKKLSEAVSGENNPNWGKHPSPETIEKISKSEKGKVGLKGKDNPMFGKTGLQHPKYGMEVSQETRKKLSEALTGRTFSQETIKKMSKAQQGEKGPNSKLIEKQVRMIKVLLRSDIKTLKQIGKLFNVHGSTISNIKCGIRWKYLN
jgi:group I intron endonuclease